VAERSDELCEGHATIHKENKLVQATMRGLQEQMRRGTEQFELDQGSLEAISQRVTALRTGLADFENRFRGLDDTSKVVTDVGRKVDEVSARASTISAELGRLSEQAELVEGMRDGMTQALATASEIAGGPPASRS
jgi:methyl-accepting chemotaxis protein